MRTFLIRRSRPTAAALIIALVTFCVNCVQAVDSTPEHMASSAAMGDDCPMAAEHGRCAGETLQVQQGPVAKQLVLSPPSLVLAAIFVQAEPRHHESQCGTAAIGAVLKLPGVPTYLLDSTFRI